MLIDPLFFPRVNRREAYCTKQDGGFFANYREYRNEIREDCQGRCVYCDCHENEAGGSECMELDHFRPYSLAEYVHLKNNPTNLVLACCGCNRLKSNYWPARGTPGSVLGDEGFVDPFEEDRREYFAVSASGEITPLRPPAKYIVALLALNRPTRKRIRELRNLHALQLSKIEEKLLGLQQLLQADNLTDEQRRLLKEIVELLEDQKALTQTLLLDFELH
jgi:hypothetical protein